MLRFKSVVKMLIRNDAVLCATENSILVPPYFCHFRFRHLLFMNLFK